MRNPWTWLALWAVTLGGAWWLGSESAPAGSGGSGPGVAPDVAALEAENERLRRALEERGPVLEAGATGPPAATADTTPLGTPGAAPAKEAGEEPVPRLDIQDVQTADELVARFLAYVRAMLAKGEAGHLELLQAFNDMLFASEENQQKLQQLFDSDDEAARYIYPLIRFMVNNEASVVSLTETAYKTMANDPMKFESLDDDTLEFFTEGISYVLPGAVSEERLATFRGYAKKILDTPEAQQPDAVRKNRRRIERVMRVWAPRLSPEDTLARLRAGDVTPQEAAALLRKLPPDLLAEVDVVRWLGPLVEQGDYRTIRALSSVRLSPGQQAQLDGHFLDGAEKSNVHEWLVVQYLRSTGRTDWADARGLIEQGLERGGRTVHAFAASVMQLANKPDADWVRWMLDRYAVNEHVRKRLKAAFKLD